MWDTNLWLEEPVGHGIRIANGVNRKSKIESGVANSYLGSVGEFCGDMFEINPPQRRTSPSDRSGVLRDLVQVSSVDRLESCQNNITDRGHRGADSSSDHQESGPDLTLHLRSGKGALRCAGERVRRFCAEAAHALS
jgi:hypothetical protein